MKLVVFKFIPFILIFLLGMATGRIWLEQENQTSVSTDSPIAFSPKANEQFAILKEENTRLHEKVLQLEKSKTVISSPENTLKSDQTVDLDQNQETYDLEAEVSRRVGLQLKAQREADAFIEKYITPNDGQNIDYETRLLIDFETEEKDLDWAPAQENKLYTLFDENSDLRAIALEEADCRKQRCRLQILTDQGEDINKTIEALQAALENDENIGSSVSVAADLDQGRTNFFITRNTP